jgi:aminoglycoside phosphotransferase (APT) family kinase protein
MSQSRFADVVAHHFPGAQLAFAERLTGGVSAEVHRLDLRWPDGRGERLVLRAHGATHNGHPAALEYALLATLRDLGVPVAEPLQLDDTRQLLPEPYLILAFVEGTTAIPATQADRCISRMGELLAQVHDTPIAALPKLPHRTAPLPELFDYLPTGPAWRELTAQLRDITDAPYAGDLRLLHGDFWPENLLWQTDDQVVILDWEDAALGDPLSDVASARVELRYKFGRDAMTAFTQAYARHHAVEPRRLALWQIYVAAAAAHFMSQWRLDPAREAHMRAEALASIREAAAALRQAGPLAG